MGNPLVSTATVQLKNRDGGYGSAPLSVVPFLDLTHGDGYIVADGNKKFFRRCLVGQAYSSTIELYNVGFASQSIDSISSPSLFTVTPSQSLPVTLQPGASLTLQVQYSPSGTGAESEEITVTTGGRDLTLYLGATTVSGAASTVNITTDTGALVELDTANTDYVLQTNLDITGPGFAVTADNITLDLNGYNVTYGDASNAKNAGINLLADYRADTITGLVGKGGGSSHGFLLTGEGSELIQRAGSATEGHCIHVWSQAGNFHQFEKVKLKPAEDSAHAIYGSSGGDGTFVKNLTIDSSVTTIGSRHQYDGYMIKVESDDRFWSLSGLTMSGGAQGGFVGADTLHTQVTNCNISHQAIYVNGFAIFNGKFSDTWNNVIPATASGRALRSEDDSYIWNNTVDIQERYNTAESGYLEAYGLQIEKETGTDAARIKVFSNIIVARAYSLGDGGNTIRSTSVGSGNNSIVHDNILASYRDAAASSPSCVINAIQANTNPGETPLFTNNSFYIDELLFYSFWDGVSNLDIRDSTVGLGPNPADAGNTDRSLALAYIEQGASRPYDSVDNNIVNTTIHNSISRDSINIKDNPTTATGINYGWSYTLTVTTDGVTPLVGATVVIDDGSATEVLNTTTDANGQISTDLFEHEVTAAAAAAAIKTDVSLHDVTISAAGYVTQNYSVDMTQARAETKTMVAV